MRASFVAAVAVLASIAPAFCRSTYAERNPSDLL